MRIAKWVWVLGLGVAIVAPAWGVAWASVPSVRDGAAISPQCAACHGSNGMSVATNIPDLAGQHYNYLLGQLEAFHDGTRKSPIMNEMARPLSRQQMQDIAAYFASIKVHVGGAPKAGG